VPNCGEYLGRGWRFYRPCCAPGALLIAHFGDEAGGRAGSSSGHSSMSQKHDGVADHEIRLMRSWKAADIVDHSIRNTVPSTNSAA
jgi:hypothetical protein